MALKKVASSPTEASITIDQFANIFSEKRMLFGSIEARSSALRGQTRAGSVLFLDRSDCMFYNVIANFLSLFQLIGGLNMEDNAKNYKILQNSLFDNACHLVGVKGIGVHLL